MRRSSEGDLANRYGTGSSSKLEARRLKLGTGLERILPGTPHLNGLHERMNRVLKAEAARPPAAGTFRPIPTQVQPIVAARSAGTAR